MAGTIAGLRVGHATDSEARTGCTVLIGPFRGACDVRGLATGTREIDALSPAHLVPVIDALLLTGGSAFGLAAADGVVSWLEERGMGFETGAARVPIVPAAVIYDLRVGRSDRRPDAAMGRAACEAAVSGPITEGRVGAGTGATAGKILGPEHAVDAGLGVWSGELAGYAFFALAVVNPLGDVLGADGSIIAGARAEDGGFLDAARALREHGAGADFGQLAETPVPGTNTTLGVVATEAPLTREALHTVARMAATALARRIAPVNTPFDGDVVFALSTASESRIVDPREQLALGSAAAWSLEQAIERAVTVSQ
ncbi:MAG: P1 family peptidase [Longimicrobiales bacterium]